MRKSANRSSYIGGAALSSGLYGSIHVIADILGEASRQAEMWSSTGLKASFTAFCLATVGYLFHDSSVEARTADVYLAAALTAEAQNQQPPLQTETQPAPVAWTGTDPRRAS